MTTQGILNLFSLTIFGVVVFFIVSFVRSCNTGIYQPGSGLGSIADIGDEKYKHSYLQKYADTLFTIYPKYKVPEDDPTEQMTSGYEFLNMTKFYFDTSPREIYCVQWEGTGFISVRFAYNYETAKAVIENTREKIFVKEIEKQRVAKRLRTEILDKIDSIIATSPDRDSAIYVSGI